MTNKTNNPLYAIQCFFKGLSWLGKAPLRKFLLIPILINLLLYSVALVLGYFYLSDVINSLIPGWLHWLSWLLWPLFFICFIVVGFFSFTILANLIASPFYGKLSEKTLELIVAAEASQNEDKGKDSDSDTDEDTENTSPEPDAAALNWQHVMLGELRRIGYLVKWILVLLIISIIPGLNLLAPLLWVIFGAWGCALEFFTYPLENKGLLFPEQKSLVASVRLGALSFGGVVLLGLGLPVLNLLVGPAAVIAATFYVHEIEEATKKASEK